MAAVPFSGKALTEERAGLRRIRVGRFRIIYRNGHDTFIDLVAVGPRERIYEETYGLLKQAGKNG